jgi:hypothetical protein
VVGRVPPTAGKARSAAGPDLLGLLLLGLLLLAVGHLELDLFAVEVRLDGVAVADRLIDQLLRQ